MVSLIQKKLRDQFLKNKEIIYSQKQKFEILKQECKVESLNTCIRKFQRQAHSNHLEMDDVNYGYEESRREQARQASRRIASTRKKDFEILVSEISMKWKNSR